MYAVVRRLHIAIASHWERLKSVSTPFTFALRVAWKAYLTIPGLSCEEMESTIAMRLHAYWFVNILKRGCKQCSKLTLRTHRLKSYNNAERLWCSCQSHSTLSANPLWND